MRVKRGIDFDHHLLIGEYRLKFMDKVGKPDTAQQWFDTLKPRNSQVRQNVGLRTAEPERSLQDYKTKLAEENRSTDKPIKDK